MNIVSLFSGAGGLDLGMTRAGHSIVWANDNDLDSVKTYKANIGSHIVHDDIENISTQSIPEADLVIGGFPCQGFSQANLLRSEQDTRNKLYLEFLRVVRDKQPKFFLAENVRGILSMAGGAAIKKIISDFSSIGYCTQAKLLNAADYGVPQSRQRVIIVGKRIDLPSKFEYHYPIATHGKTGSGKLRPWVSIAKALRNVPDPEDDHCLLNHEFSKYKVTNRNFTGHRTTDPKKPSPTILARGNGKGGVCALQHPQNHRRMSIREQAILQTFPIKFEFFGKMNSCYRQVGNAVPVLFAQKLGESFFNNADPEILS